MSDGKTTHSGQILQLFVQDQPTRPRSVMADVDSLAARFSLSARGSVGPPRQSATKPWTQAQGVREVLVPAVMGPVGPSQLLGSEAAEEGVRQGRYGGLTRSAGE